MLAYPSLRDFQSGLDGCTRSHEYRVRGEQCVVGYLLSDVNVTLVRR